MSENGDASAPAPVVDRDLHPYSIQAFLNAIHPDDLSHLVYWASGQLLRVDHAVLGERSKFEYCHGLLSDIDDSFVGFVIHAGTNVPGSAQQMASHRRPAARRRPRAIKLNT
jgi:hypothetical protein